MIFGRLRFNHDHFCPLPHPQSPPTSLTVRISKSALFRCIVESDPSLTLSVSWFKDGEKLSSGGYVKVKDVSDARAHAEASVEILSVEERNSGEYACVASTELEEKVQAVANLAVLDVPQPPYTPEIVEVRGLAFCLRVRTLELRCLLGDMYYDVTVSE